MRENDVRKPFHFGTKFRAFSALSELGVERLNRMTKEELAEHLTRELGEEITPWHIQRLRKANSVAGIPRPLPGWRLRQGARATDSGASLVKRVVAFEALLVELKSRLVELESRFAELEARVDASSSVTADAVPARGNGARYVVHNTEPS